MWLIGEALVRLLAPIMSFTADEVWCSLPKASDRQESVHLAHFPKAEDLTGDVSGLGHLAALRTDFDALMAVRDDVLKALEVARKEKLIGSGLEAMVTIQAPAERYQLMERYKKDLRYLFIVSAVDVKNSGNGKSPLHVEVGKAPGNKCERCWNYSVLVGKSSRYPGLCERCVAALEEIDGESKAPVQSGAAS